MMEDETQKASTQVLNRPESANAPASLKLSATAQELLRCPACHAKLRHAEHQFICSNSQCGIRFPVIGGIPVLLNERNSVFKFEDFTSHCETFFKGQGRLLRLLNRITPSISLNIRAKRNLEEFRKLLLAQSARPRVLIVGGGILGSGLEVIVNDPSIEVVESDVSLESRTKVVCDSHDIPFEDEAFDGVVVQSVLEHVVDPTRCVSEIWRVLKKQGMVYAETPFIQQVHGRQYDFTRFTLLGHRRLFRQFDEIASGAACGPGMALAWSYQHFLLSFTSSRISRILMRGFSCLTSFHLKYFDYFLIDKPLALDSAAECYFLGRKSSTILSDLDLMRQYKGGG